jgi:cytochrome c oxidase assembly protein subunit 15
MIGLFLLLLQILLGAWTSTNYAALSCPDFPFCLNDSAVSIHLKEAFNLFSPIGVNYEGGVLPDDVRQTIHMTHRIGAGIVTIFWFGLMMCFSTTIKNSEKVTKICYVIYGLIILQLCIGISNILFKLPLVTAIAHNLVAVILLLAVLTLVNKLVTLRRML